ncbi:phage integrase family protein [Idiomarina loihiensis]|uniref:tyrosine-type recombinase/integrase n=1 Tax=Idiomarina TaxID=135575 RepID=UPI000D845D6B|nr:MULTISPECIES: tyrosine-type recombinase/integrase [Idiomarina]PWW36983.1 phage integrase family protein [Idiomarina loihiensis]TDP46791.1 phage integrase family protein [Idiomarina loihiensis]TDS23062.1 phage integrase family protein [Idiomarina sp. H2]
MSDFTQTDIARALISAHKLVRNEVDVVFAVLNKHCRDALNADKQVAENYLQRRALSVYQHATTNELLEALWLSMRALYLFKSEHQALIQPVEFRPLKQQETLINEHNPVFLLQSLLERKLDDAIASLSFFQFSDTQRYLLHALSIAKRSHITDSKTLLSVLEAKQRDLLCFSDLHRASVLIETSRRQRVWLDAEALLHLRRAQAIQASKKQLLNKAFEQWWQKIRATEPAMASTALSFNDALLALNFQTTPIAEISLSTVTTVLSDESLILALSGQINEEESEAQTHHVSRKRQRKTAIAALTGDTYDKKTFGVDSGLRLAFSPEHRAGNVDRQLIDALRRILSTYEEQVYIPGRSGKALKRARSAIEQLLFNTLGEDAEQAPSVLAQLLALFCADLFLFGSASKKRLKASSIRSYLSTLSVFLVETLSDEELVVDAQSNVDALYELTHRLADAISDLEATDKQSTVLRFLQYAHEISELRLYDFDELELAGVTVESVRAHFIPAQLFDSTCHAFHAMRSSAREQTALMMQLCYYAGLRRNEALLLAVDDINVESDVLYVTKFAGRKTANAPRKISLALLPQSFYLSLLNYVEMRSKTHDRLFDAQTVQVHEREFMALLREQTQIPDLVVHSLRHCAANNLLLVLAQGAFPSIQAAIGRYFLTQQNSGESLTKEPHELFSSKQLERIHQALSAEGRALNSYFPILDFLAMMLGHATPATSAASYLHFFDLVTFELSSMRASPLNKSVLHNLLPQTNARFETSKRVFTSNHAEKALFKTAAFGLADARKLKTQVQPSAQPVDTVITFSDFIDALYDYQYRPLSHLSISKHVQRYFEGLTELPNVQFLQQLSPRAFPTWIRFQERMTAQRWLSVEQNAISTLKRCLKKETVSNKRDAEQILRAFRILGLGDCIMELNCDDGSWRSLIERVDYQVRIKETEQKKEASRVEMRIKPYRLRWPLWDKLPNLLCSLELYAAFRQVDEETEK